MNKVILAGRLTKDPEVRYTQTGKAVASFTLAVNRRFTKEKDKQQADFIPIVIWDKLAEVCGNYLVKGTQVLIEGRIQIRNYDAKDGSKRYVTEVIAQSVEFMGSKSTTNTGGAVPEAAKSFGSEIPPDEEIPF
ncbi:single-stranded DNA-binding protein [Megamonas funiformis]|uniref:Single-stranded DNA-binding protein n=1 Tax=Megamonas funiformis YIT 11815 TaxID=742816 RepID=A0ABN0EKH3_9FIRM|nr:single-stranded DNA-binding protein [Megamonas funiformis]EHR38743.1 single-strand binding protein [Megamonas funiformis YIT 11815]QIB60124.1 single-stranded DNA-binding protein [Megamonas funiformis]